MKVQLAPNAPVNEFIVLAARVQPADCVDLGTLGR